MEWSSSTAPELDGDIFLMEVTEGKSLLLT